MNRLILIGNGFDLAHGLKTSYKDFINWYWEQRLDKMYQKKPDGFRDPLCDAGTVNVRNLNYEYYKKEHLENGISPIDYIRGYSYDDDTYKETGVCAYDFIAACYSFFNDRNFIIDNKKYPLMARIMQSVETKGWVDIENDYYDLLKETVKDEKCTFTAKQLNDQLLFLKEKLAEYLEFSNGCSYLNEEINDKMMAPIKLEDISITDRAKVEKEFSEVLLEPDKNSITKVLNFNYTPTALQYMEDEISIHGSLVDSKKMIFGYGDEMDEDYKEIVNKNDNELLKYTKSVRYLESTNYSRVLEFMESDYFQVVIMGHSCGTSDRTLLNTIFEHPNCVSIKPYYHKMADGTDNYLDIVQNIYRNFTDKKMYRDRVVCKDRCEPLIDKTVKKIKVR